MVHIEGSNEIQIIHLHTSNPFFRFYFAVFCRLFRIRLIQTYHGNLGRFGILRNAFDFASVLLTYLPIVINQKSFIKARKLNRKAQLISAFISSTVTEVLPEDLAGNLQRWMGKYDSVFCTNASNLKFDKHGREVYSGSELMKIFGELPGIGLIFSDPSGEYLAYLEKEFERLPENVFFITRNHSFLEIIKLSDCFIRASTTDGDSLSIKEALSLQVNVIASDCVNRPEGSILYKDGDSEGLKREIQDFSNPVLSPQIGFDETDKIVKLYRSMRFLNLKDHIQKN